MVGIPFYTTHKNGDERNMVYGIAIPTLILFIFVDGLDIYDIYGIYDIYDIYDIYGIYDIYDIYDIQHSRCVEDLSILMLILFQFSNGKRR